MEAKKLKKILHLLKLMPSYSVIYGWNRSSLARSVMAWFLAPHETDDSIKAQHRRQFIASYQLDELSQKLTPYYNRQPFVNMLQMSVTFDRLLEYSVALGISPFKDLPNKINNLTVGVYGNWIGGLQWPNPFLQKALDDYFIKNLGPRHHIFEVVPDARMIQLGYLSDGHLEDRENWRGDRSLPGGDSSLRLTSKAASFPLYSYTEKKTLWGPRDTDITYEVKIIPTRVEEKKKLSLEQRYVRRAYFFGLERFERLKLLRQLLGHMEVINRYREFAKTAGESETW